ncbi:hypothetical protein AOLI_G00167630 [Acnodon oligacanthus]
MSSRARERREKGSPLRAQRDGPRALALHGSSKNPYRSALDTRSCSPSCLSRRRAERHQVGLPEFLTTDVTIENLSVLDLFVQSTGGTMSPQRTSL